MIDSLSHLLHVCATIDPEPTAEDVADALWLLQQSNWQAFVPSQSEEASFGSTESGGNVAQESKPNQTSSKLGFIQSRGVTERVSQALEKWTWDLYEVVVFLGQ